MQPWAIGSAGLVTEAEAISLNERLTYAFSVFCIATFSGYVTPTIRRRLLRAIVHAARALLKHPTSSAHRNRLYESLRVQLSTKERSSKSDLPQQDVDAKAIIGRALNREGHDLWQLQQRLANEEQLHLEDCVALRFLGKLDPKKFSPTSTKYPDPALGNLITDVAEIWQQVTGRSIKPYTGKQYGEKCHPFGEWLLGELKRYGVRFPPSKWRVIEITGGRVPGLHEKREKPPPPESR
jgi:hypothetical protein